MPRGRANTDGGDKRRKAKLIDPEFGYKNPNAEYPAQTIVAILDNKTPEGFSFAKLLEDVFETSTQVRASFLRVNQDFGTDVTYTSFLDGDVQVDSILKEIPYKLEKQKKKRAPPVYNIEKSHFDSLTTLAQRQAETVVQEEARNEEVLSLQDLIKIGPKADDKEVSSESSEEEDEEEESDDEEEAGEEVAICLDEDEEIAEPRKIKRVKGRKEPKPKKKKKKAKKEKAGEAGDRIEEEKSAGNMQVETDGFNSEEEEEDDEDEEEEYVPVKRKGGEKKAEGVKRGAKKRIGEDKNSVTKTVGLEEEDEEEPEGEDDEEGGKKKKRKTKPKGEKKEKAPRQKKPKKMPDTYKKGKFNPKVSVETYYNLLMNPSDAIMDYGCTKTNNKNLIRAVYTKNYTLLENILKNSYFLSSLHQQWGPENDVTALRLAIKQNDLKAAKLLIDTEYARTYRFCGETLPALQKVDTGNVSKAAFGVEIRKVNLMRGGREGNNAFTHDQNNSVFDLDELFEYPLDKEIIDYLRLKAGANEVFSRIGKLVLSGDRQNAGYLANLANENGGYGFNYLHVEALTKEKFSELTPNIKKVSVTKKPLGNFVITPLHCAAINPNTEILEELLKLVPDYSIADEKMRKLIHYAACCEKPGPLRLLLSKGVDPREKDQTGLTPFMYACYYGRAENVDVLLKEAKVDPLFKTKDGMMGVHWAAQRGHLNVIKVLLENKVNLNTKGGRFKMTPLHFAAAHGHNEMVEFLLENKGKVLGKDKLKRTPLSLAVRNGNLQIASLLLSKGSDYEQADSSNNYPIHYAAGYGFPECIEVLVKAGADVNVKNSFNLTPLTVAMLKNNFHCVKTLLSYPETDVNAKDEYGRTLVSLLIDVISEDNLDRITFLLRERNCNIKQADSNNVTPLHYACKLQAQTLAFKNTSQLLMTEAQRQEAIKKAQDLKMRLIQLIMEFGADVNATTNNLEVPMLYAVTYFDPELIEYFLNVKGINLGFKDRNQNNIYRLLYSHCINDKKNRKLLEKVIQKAGNTKDILNEEKTTTATTTNYNAYNNYGLMGLGGGYNSYNNNYNQNNTTSTLDPMQSADSAFTCYKRTLMNLSLQSYLDKEEKAIREEKRQQALKESQEKQQQQQQQTMQNLFAGAPSVPTNSLLGNQSNLFSSSPAQQNLDLFLPGGNTGGLLGGSAGGLFGGNAGGLLGGNAGGLFGGNAGGLFGNVPVQQPSLLSMGGGGLLGGGSGMLNLQQPNLLGGGVPLPVPQQNTFGGSLFGAMTAAPQQRLGGGLFGNLSNQPQQAFLSNASSSLISTSNMVSGASLFGGNQQQPRKLGVLGSAQMQNNSSSNMYPTSAQNQVTAISAIKLTKDEIKAYKEKAYKEFDAAVTSNLKLLEKFAAAGGILSPDETDLSKSEYHNDPRFLMWTLETFKPDLNNPNKDGNTVLFNLIHARNKLLMTPEARKALVDYLSKPSNDSTVIEKYSDFRLFLELYHRYGADFNFRNKHGVSPVLYLLKDRDLANAGFLDEMIAYGADVNQPEDDSGTTPFLEAIYAYDVNIIEKLLELKVDVNKKDKKGFAPLHYLAKMDPVKSNAMDTAKIILKGGNIEIDIQDDQDARTPLHMAILNCARGLVKVLINAGANVNKTDKDWSNSLYFATKVGDLVLMREIGDRIQDKNFSGHLGLTPLHLAVSNGKPEHVEYLLKIGGNPNAKDYKGITPLMLAVQIERVELVRILLKNGGNPNEKDDFERSPLHYAANNSKPEQMFEMEDVLIRSGADINAPDMYGRTALHYAFTAIAENPNFHRQNDPVETVTGLSAVPNIDLDAKDRRGRRPLHYAAQHGAYICILLMIKNQITLDEADADGNTPLALALANGFKDTAAILIQNGASATNQIYRVNEENFLWAHPKDKKDEEAEEQAEAEKKSPSKQANGDKMEIQLNGDEMEIEATKENKDKDESSSSSSEEDDKEKKSMLVEGEEDEDNEEEDDDDSATEELDDAEANELQQQVEYLAVPTEAKETIRKPSDADKNSQRINTSKIQAAIDSFFAISIRKGWQGIAYLLLQNGYNLMEAIKDALNENQFKYVLALMTKIQDATLRQTDQKNQNLFHIFAAKGHRAPADITTKIFEGFMMRGVDYAAVDSTGRTPLHYATESNFGFLEDKLLENKVDGNLLDNTGKSILHLALLRNNLTKQKLQKFFDYKIDLNTKFIHYIRQISPLHYVAENSNYELEKEMLLLGADPNAEDDKGLTPFQKVFIQNSMNINRFQLYIQAYANLNKLFTLTYKNRNEKGEEEEVKKTYTLLHFAAEKGWSNFEDHLLMYGADASIENNEGKTAFDIALSQVSHELTLERLRLYILCRAPIKKPSPIKIRKKVMHVSPVIYLMNLKHRRENLVILKELLDSGVSVNDVDDDGWSAITYAIRKNSILHLRIFLSYPNLNRNMRDKQGKTPIHHVVNPMDYASYDNVEMLQLLAMYFDINALDDRKKPPIYYAYFQDSGVMKNALLQLGAVDQKPASELQRQATSIIAGVDWAEEVDYEADAERYIAAEEAKKMDDGTIEKIQPDERAQNRHNLEVVYDDELGPYSLFMTKVDIKKGTYGEYLFYRMQVLYDKNRENYILFTKYGRIGDDGMYQQTPFPSKEETIQEFCKIFKDKSGNEWKDKANFQKKDHKYKLLNITSRKNQKDYVQPIDWTAKNLPKSQMDIPIRKVIRAISEVKIYRDYFGRHNIDQQLLPFGRLTKDLIFEAKRLLLDIKEILEEIQERPSEKDEDVEILIKLKEKLADRSSKFYELIPDSRFRLIPIRPIDNMNVLNEKVNLVNDMLDFEVSSKILLGALNNIRTKNPLDYCFEALNIRLLTLNKAQREHKLIEQYIKNGAGSQGVRIEKIFALERRGEAERISQWKDLKNRTYLWHGSKVINFMGILSQGLRIAPPEAPATGYMFGKGIYFADTFAKSYGYCNDWNRRDESKFLILCEVALGDSLEQFGANYITKLDAPYKSVKGCGRVGPDPASNIVLANGAIVPIGTQINYEYHNMFGQRIQPTLNYNEYIVYDISQVRMRYLIQVK